METFAKKWGVLAEKLATWEFSGAKLSPIDYTNVRFLTILLCHRDKF
jgi:hypothetical protein